MVPIGVSEGVNRKRKCVDPSPSSSLEEKSQNLETLPRLVGKDGLIYLGLEREFLFIVEDFDPLVRIEY